MKFILDACVAISMVLEEQDTPAARVLREDFRNGVQELIAPDSLPLEVGHALTRAERQGKLQPGRGLFAFDDFLDACPRLFPYFDYIGRAIQLSSAFRLGTFDCVSVALAEDQECEVITSDRRLLELFPTLTISLQAL